MAFAVVEVEDWWSRGWWSEKMLIGAIVRLIRAIPVLCFYFIFKQQH